MTRTQIIKEFQKKKPDFDRLGKNLVEALKTFLDEKKISYLDIYYRVKKIDSFLEKIERKKYLNPFSDIEDVCGIRIICYYASDIDIINEIIKNEFSVEEEQNKADLLGLKEFAYRSKHYIIKVKDSWKAAPNYRNLEDCKAELQVRTILMHAWAEIEHKLNYKSDSQVPEKFQRKLFRLSAKFEEADEQFEELREGINAYRAQLQEKITKDSKFDNSQDFNIESYTAFIKFNFPKEEVDSGRIGIEFEDYSQHNKNFEILQNALDIVSPHFNEIKKDLLKSGYGESFGNHFPSSELLGFAVDVIDDESFHRRTQTVKEWRDVVTKWRKTLK
jgi:putative GTP pyrophosphokinase